MKRSIALTYSAAAFLAVCAVSTAAEARCCRSFWRCAAAVATAGASCGAEEARERIQEFVDRVKRNRDEGEAKMGASLAEMNEETAEQSKDLHESSTNAHKQVQAAKRRGDTAAEGSKQPGAIKQSMQQARAELAKLERESASANLQSSTELVKANNDRRRQVSALNSTFQATFVAPLTALLGPFLSTSDPLTTAATLVAAARSLNRIEQKTEQVMSRAVDGYHDKLKPYMDKLFAHKESQMARKDRAEQIAAAMERLRRDPSNKNRGALDLLVNPAAARPKLRTPKPGALPRIDGKNVKKALPQVAKPLAKDAEFARGVKLSKSYDRKLASSTLETELGKRLSGKTRDALDKQEAAFLAEAQAQFPEDKTTLVALEKLIREEANKRRKAVGKKENTPVKPAPAPAPVKPKVPQKPAPKLDPKKLPKRP